MIVLMTMNLMILLISLIIMMLSTFLSKKSLKDREKSSPFECGFEPFLSSRMPFSIQFFLIAIIFLIFDVEIALIFPLILTFKISNLTTWISSSLLFMFILLLGLYHEWHQGALNWSK